MLTIKQVEPLADYRLRAHLSNGKVLEPCIAQYLDAPCYEGLRDSYSLVQVDEWGYAAEWPDDSDIPLSALQRLAKERAGKAYPVAAFNQWMRSNGLFANEAAKVLGLSRRTITGARSIPPM